MIVLFVSSSLHLVWGSLRTGPARQHSRAGAITLIYEDKEVDGVQRSPGIPVSAQLPLVRLRLTLLHNALVALVLAALVGCALFAINQYRFQTIDDLIGAGLRASPTLHGRQAHATLGTILEAGGYRLVIPAGRRTSALGVPSQFQIVPLARTQQRQDTLQATVIGSAVVLFAVSVVSGWFLTGRTLRPKALG